MIFTSIPGGVYMFVYKSRVFSYLYILLLLLLLLLFPPVFQLLFQFFSSWDHIFLLFILVRIQLIREFGYKKLGSSIKKIIIITNVCLFYYFLVVDTMEGYEYSHYINNTGVTYIFHLSTVGSVIIFIIHVETKTQ